MKNPPRHPSNEGEQLFKVFVHNRLATLALFIITKILQLYEFSILKAAKKDVFWGFQFFFSFQKRERGSLNEWLLHDRLVIFQTGFTPFYDETRNKTKEDPHQGKKTNAKTIGNSTKKKKLSPKRFFVYSLIFFNGCFGKAAILLILFYLADYINVRKGVPAVGFKSSYLYTLSSIIYMSLYILQTSS